MKNFLAPHLLALGLVATAITATAPAFAQPAEPPAARPFAQSRPIPGRYIVVFKDSVGNPAAEAANLMNGRGGQLHHTYTSAIKGFAASLPDAAMQAIRNNPNVDYVEPDATVSLNETKLASTVTQSGATWGLDRIDWQPLSLNGTYRYNFTGAGVNAFIIDTGILSTHTQFGGRVNVGAGKDTVGDNRGTEDCNGHGTHVAGTVGGSTYGVAKNISLIPVRVLNCSGSGTWSGVIAGIDFAANSTLRPAVANMSLGGGASSSVDAAVAGAVNKGVVMVVAAGNSNANACNYSPARAPSAITVGATTNTDARASYSNYGSCLDLFAPGSSITSGWYTSTTATNTISGTSMASPHVAGVAALALAANPAASPAAVASFLAGNAATVVISSAGTGSPNRLVYSLAEGAPTESTKQVVAVKSITGSSTWSGTRWLANATVTIGDARNNYASVPYATVTGSFSRGGTASCVTDSNGICTLRSASISRSYSSTALSMTNVTGANLTYDSSQNLASQITIRRP